MGESNCNWLEEEQVQLCDSWARLTVCSITGKARSLSGLWDQIFSDYVENWHGPPTSRTASALQSKFRGLKKVLKDWHNAQIRARNRIASGTNMMDQMNQAQSIFMGKHPKQFDHWACWEKVKNHPTFVDPPSTHREPASYSTPIASENESPIDLTENESPIDLEDDIVLETPSSSMPRPMGQKRAKEAKRKGKKVQDAAESMALSIKCMAESTQASLEIVRQRNEEMAAHSRRVFEFEEVKEDARIMGTDTSNMSPDEKRWWKTRKRSVMAKTLFDNGSSDAYMPHFD